jgi:hypothetical protein
VRDEPQRGLNIKVAAFEVIKRKRNEHVDRAILPGTRLRCRGGHAVNPSKILIAFSWTLQA